MSIVIAILILGFIILCHEGGHFLFAKLFKVPVLEFSLGMGKRIVSIVRGKTRYSIKLMPFGGSCAMLGEDIAGTGDFTELGFTILENGDYDYDGVIYTKEEVEKNNFSCISPIKKIIICFAGPLFNVLIAFLAAICIVVAVGVDKPIISEIVEGSPSAVASPYAIESGDEIIAVESPTEKEKVTFARDLILFMNLNNDDIVELKQPLGLTFRRNGTIYKTMLIPEIKENRGTIGVSLSGKYTPRNIFDIMYYAYHECYFYIDITFKSIKMLINGKAGLSDMAGPVGTVAVMGDTIKSQGTNVLNIFISICMLIDLISINLAIMNLIPIPALDGGRILLSAIAMVIGHPLDKKIEATINVVTMVLLLALMFYLCGQDVYRIMTGGFG